MRFPSDSTSTRARRGRSVSRAARQVVEQLEGRQLLAVVSAGQVGYFYSGGATPVRVAVTGEGSVTLIAGRRPVAGGSLVIDELPLTVTGPGATTYNGGFNDNTNLPAGAVAQSWELFAVLSGDSTSKTSVNISAVTPRGNAPTLLPRVIGGVADPFGAGAGSLITDMGNPGQDLPVTLTLNNGGVFIGGRQTFDQAATDPVYQLRKSGTIATSPGVRLRTGDVVRPGIYSTGSFDNLFVAGTITGAVSINGSVDTMYAGNVLTGDVRFGDGTSAFPDRQIVIGTDNFAVGGDLRNLIVSGSIGTVTGAPFAFMPNTDLQIGGRVQQIRTEGEFRGSIDVGGSDAATRDTSVLTELESRTVNNANGAAIGAAFQNFQLVNQGFTNNDTFANPQILGSFFSTDRGRGTQAVVNGSIANLNNVGDAADFYGVPLLAGQEMVVRVATTGFFPVGVQVYDPDGNIVASDFSNQNTTDFANKSFVVKADQPGLWRVAVVPPQLSLLAGPRNYQLTVDRQGEVGMGGLATGGDVYMTNLNLGVRVRRNDLGAILADGDLYAQQGLVSNGTGFVPTNPITADSGNIRSVEAANISYLSPAMAIGLFPNIIAGRSVGLVRANGAAAATRLYFNYDVRGIDDAPSDAFTIGGDWQVVETQGDFSATLSANGGIGVIRVGSVGLVPTIATDPGFYEVNADGVGNDGIIGLIDVQRDFGTFTQGGPAIGSNNQASGNGGGRNVRYIRVGGTAYRDAQFGAGNTQIDQNVNGSLSITDDSGATITITPIARKDFVAPQDVVEDPDDTDPGNPTGTPFPTNPLPSPFQNGTIIPNPFGGTPVNDTNGDGVIDEDDLDPDAGNDDDGGVQIPVDTVDDNGNVDGTVTRGTIRVESYQIRGGGAAIISVTVSEGVQINTSGTGATAQGDIGELITGTASAIAVPRALDTVSGSDGNDDDDTAATPATPARTPIDFGASALVPLQLASGRTLEVLLTGIRTNVYSIHGAGLTTTDTGAAASYTRIVNATDGEILDLRANSVGYLEAQYLGVGRPGPGGVTIQALTAPASTVLTAVFPLQGSRNLIAVNNAIDVRSRGPMGNVAATGIIQNLFANSDNVNQRGVSEGIVAPVFATNSIRNVDIGEGLTTSGTGDQIQSGIFSSGNIGRITNTFGGGDLRGDVLFQNFLGGIALTGGGSIVNADILQSALGNLSGGSGAGLPAFAAGNERVILFVQLTGGSSTNAGIGDITISGGNGGIISSQFVGLNLGLVTVEDGGFGVFTSRFFSSGGGTMAGIESAGLGIRGISYTGGSTVGEIFATGGGRLANINQFSPAVTAGDTTYFDALTGLQPNASLDLFDYIQTGTGNGAIVGVTNEGIISDSTIAASQSVQSVRGFDFRVFNNPLNLRPSAASYPMTINFGQQIGSVSAKRDIDGLRVSGATIGQIVSRDMKNLQVQATAAVGLINAKRNIAGSANFNLTNDSSLGTLAVGGYMNGNLSASRGIGSVVIDGDFASQQSTGGLFSGLNIRSIKIGGDVREGGYIRARKRISTITINGDLEAGGTIRANPFGTIKIAGSTNGRIQRK